MPSTIDRTPTQAFTTESTPQVPPLVLAAANLLNLVEKFRSYGDNWGTYGEKAIKSSACDQSQHFISNFAFWKPTVSLHVYPTAGGDIGIDWDLGSQSFTAIFTGAEVRFLTDTENATDMDEIEYQTEGALLSALKLDGFEGV
jgi:hypothetical protein